MAKFGNPKYTFFDSQQRLEREVRVIAKHSDLEFLDNVIS